MSDFLEELAADMLSDANRDSDVTWKNLCEETASELMTLARECREYQEQDPGLEVEVETELELV